MPVLNRRFAVPAAILVQALVLAGCPTPPPEVACGDMNAFDLSGCDRSQLGILYTGGIFNASITWAGGSTSTASIYMVVLGAEKIDGRVAQSRFFSGSSFYVASRYEEGGSQHRLAFSGCEAQSTVHFTGKVQSCVDGAKVDEGTFEATYLDWGMGESQFSNVALASETALPMGQAAGVWVEGAFAYVAAGSGGLVVFNVTNRSSPFLVTTVEEADDDWSDAVVSGNTLYVASQKHGVILYDITAPNAPVRLGQVPQDDISVRALQVDRVSNRLFASSPAPNGEVLVFNIQAPRAPVLRWRVRTAELNLAAGRRPHDSVFFRDRVYVNHGTQGVVAFDVPPEPPGLANPVQRGAFGSLGAGMASQSSQVEELGGRTVVFEGSEGWGGHLRMVDFTSPDAPSLVGEWSLQRPEMSIHDLQLVGTKLYLAHYQAGLRILDVSNPQAPVQTGYFNTWRPFDPGRGRSFFDSAMGVRVPGDGYIYVAESARGLMIFGETGP
ncbi:MAG TPA: hypothetical protein VFB81_24530 [Myxococcales bacterium]|nr:hypothetical protein [Myxococcales bacterium]